MIVQLFNDDLSLIAFENHDIYIYKETSAPKETMDILGRTPISVLNFDWLLLIKMRDILQFVKHDCPTLGLILKIIFFEAIGFVNCVKNNFFNRNKRKVNRYQRNTIRFLLK